MLDDKKKIAAMILSKAMPEEKPEAEDAPAGEQGLQAAAEELLGAMESKNPAAVVSALRAAFSCMGHSEPEMEPEAEPEEG